MKSRMKKRASPLQTVDEHKVCVSTKVEKNDIPRATDDSMQQLTTRIQQPNKKKTKKKINKFKDDELNQKYELLPKKARKASFGRCYFAIHRESQNVVLIAMIFQKVFDQFVQRGHGAHEFLELMKSADPNLSGLREKIQCTGAVAVIMDISSNETSTATTPTGSSSSSSHGSLASTASKQNDSPREMTKPTIPTTNSKSDIKVKKEKRSQKRAEGKEAQSLNSKSQSTMPNEESTTEQKQQDEMNLTPSRSASVPKDNNESQSPETTKQAVEAPEPSWTSWFMPWSTAQPANKPAGTLLAQASEREFYETDAASAGPYDNRMNLQANKKVIKSSYYQGEAWSVVSPGYSDCDISSRPAPSILFSQDSEDVTKRIQSLGHPDINGQHSRPVDPTSSTLKSVTHDNEAEGIHRIQSLEHSLRQQIQEDRNDDERDDHHDVDKSGTGHGEDERQDDTSSTQEDQTEVLRSSRGMDPEGSHHVDPSFSAKAKEVDTTKDDEPTIEDTRISITAALERSRRRKVRRSEREEPTNSPSEKKEPENEELPASTTTEFNTSEDKPGKEDTRVSIAAKLETARRKAGRKSPKTIKEEKKIVEREEAQATNAPPLEFFKVKRKDSVESKKSPRTERGRARSRAVSPVSTAYTQDTMTVYSADYSSVLPYTLMRPRNLTFCKLITSLELADCMPLGPYDYNNVDYDEIFDEGDREARNGWFRRHDTFYSGDSRSSS